MDPFLLHEMPESVKRATVFLENLKTESEEAARRKRNVQKSSEMRTKIVEQLLQEEFEF